MNKTNNYGKNKFLTGEWRKLIFLNYVIDSKILTALLPAHTEIDLWNGKCYVSIVGFLFKNVKLKGLTIPFHVNFPEVNLRFYVRYNENGIWKRGVVFVGECVPKPAISIVANSLFKERYFTLPMRHSWVENENNLSISYGWKKNGIWNEISVEADPQSIPIIPNSEAEFITEHYWGYSKKSASKTVEYNVAHPQWEIYPVQKFRANCKLGELYGNQFDFLD